MADEPSRGQVWDVDFGPTRGHEQAGRRPGLVVSANLFNHGPAGLVVVVPLTSVAKGVPLHVRIEAPEAGVTKTSFAKPEDVRSLSKQRLKRRRGEVSAKTMRSVETSLRVVLEL